jgi:hypothetical protein
MREWRILQRPKEVLRRSTRSVSCGFMVRLLAIGGRFTALGAVAQQEEVSMAQSGGDLPGSTQFEPVLVAESLIESINASAPQDDSGWLFIIERTSTVQIIEDGELLEEQLLDLSAVVKIDFLEQGLLGLALHPEYADNGRLLVSKRGSGIT